jgi:hypothetical protein
VVGGYWLPRVQLVLDPTTTWTRTRFVPPDAFEQDAPTPGWRQSRVAQPGDENRTDGVIVAGGWDHEHCEICWGKRPEAPVIVAVRLAAQVPSVISEWYGKCVAGFFASRS